MSSYFGQPQKKEEPKRLFLKLVTYKLIIR